MLGIGEAKDHLEIGAAILKHAKAQSDNSKARDLIVALRVLYFDHSTVDLLKKVRVENKRERQEAARKLKLKLLDGRYIVRESLCLVEAELHSALSLKQQRLFSMIAHSKTSIRNELFRAIESGDAGSVDDILQHITSLNQSIEEVEDRLHIALGER